MLDILDVICGAVCSFAWFYNKQAFRSWYMRAISWLFIVWGAAAAAFGLNDLIS